MNPILKKYHGRDLIPFYTHFLWRERKIYCHIDGVSGRGSTHSYDVYIINITMGCLHLVQDQWSFSTNKGHFDEVAQQLGKVVEEYWIKYDQVKNPLSRA